MRDLQSIIAKEMNVKKSIDPKKNLKKLNCS